MFSEPVQYSTMKLYSIVVAINGIISTPMTSHVSLNPLLVTRSLGPSLPEQQKQQRARARLLRLPFAAAAKYCCLENAVKLVVKLRVWISYVNSKPPRPSLPLIIARVYRRDIGGQKQSQAPSCTQV